MGRAGLAGPPTLSPFSLPSVCASLHQPTPVEHAYWFLPVVNTCKIIQFRPANRVIRGHGGRASHWRVRCVHGVIGDQLIEARRAPLLVRQYQRGRTSEVAGSRSKAVHSNSFLEQNIAKRALFYHIILFSEVVPRSPAVAEIADCTVWTFMGWGVWWLMVGVGVESFTVVSDTFAV